MGEQTKELRPS